MTQANLKWTFSINSTERLGVNPKSNLITYAVSGVATSPDGEDSHFIATNNLDTRYPDRFKVNWNGSKARMPEVVGFGIAEDVREGTKVSDELYFTRGARIAIARRCKAIFPLARLTPAG